MRFGAVAELADALDLGSSFSGSAGSIPVSPIIESQQISGFPERRVTFGLPAFSFAHQQVPERTNVIP
jgi:hypothetical protein